jgi:MFS family permease
MAKTPRISAHGRVANGLASGLAVTLLLSPLFVPPCDGTMPMRCHWTFEVEWLLAVSVVGVAASLWFVRRVDARRVIGAVLAWFGVLVIAVTQSWVVGLCGHSEMACHHTAHWLWLWAGCLVAVGVTIAARVRTGRNVVVHVHDPWESSSTPPPIEAA